jgi:hypothetical protein
VLSNDSKKNKYLCYSRTYAALTGSFLSSSYNVNQLLQGINNCKRQTKDVKAFLVNVDKLAELKMESCSKGCIRKYQTQEEDAQVSDMCVLYDMKNQVNFYKCMWICYNKLDRRYREYWLN